jgi:hypothetical protein
MPEANSDSNNPNESTSESGDSRSDETSGRSDEASGRPNHDASTNKSEKGKEKSRALKIAGALSMVLWIIGFVLPFILKPNSPYVWLSDTCLLCGFWPLMFVHRAGWTWLVFGVLNVLIGFGLELVRFLVPAIPETFWTPEKIQFKASMLQMNQHIADMHPFLPWILIGFASTAYGIFRITKTIVKWLIKRLYKPA